MGRYIDEEKLINKIDAYVINNQDVMFIRQLIAQLETEDVTPITHAYWIGGDYGDWFCSECDSVLRFYGEPKHLRYCYRCGAKMDGDEIEHTIMGMKNEVGT